MSLNQICFETAFGLFITRREHGFGAGGRQSAPPAKKGPGFGLILRSRLQRRLEGGVFAGKDLRKIAKSRF
jgi:hypothetical protein